jgi:5-methylcytosine-specific restriction endonuclease McrA
MADSTPLLTFPTESCGGCGERVRRCPTSAPTIYCRDCRTAGLAPSKVPHGSSKRYRNGCRCVECRVAKVAAMREYAARRAAQGRPIGNRTRRVPSICETCGCDYLARVDQSGRFCSVKCANDAQGRRPEPRFRIGKHARLAIYEAADWVCQMCFEPVKRDAAPNDLKGPTLDHIHPRAHGGSDDPSNLRLACRDCNNRKGARLEFA